MRALQRERLGDTVRWVDDVAEVAPFDGLVVANELLDALPFRLFADGVEVVVGLDGERFTAVPPPPPRAVRTIERPSLEPLLRALAGALRRGRLLLIDYAAAPGDPRDPVRTYIGGQHGGDPLQAPGTQDITADVDFAAVRAILAAAGLRLVADEPQPAWLRRRGVEPPPLAGPHRRRLAAGAPVRRHAAVPRAGRRPPLGRTKGPAEAGPFAVRTLEWNRNSPERITSSRPCRPCRARHRRHPASRAPRRRSPRW